ncbi:MAG: hypothetical protein ABW157_00785 [Candidatus Thiodiazotropha sp. LLP2]
MAGSSRSKDRVGPCPTNSDETERESVGHGPTLHVGRMVGKITVA